MSRVYRFFSPMEARTVISMRTLFTLDFLAWSVAQDGVEAHRAELLSVGREARARGVSPVLVDVLLDASQPEVARQRAFGAVAAALGAQPDGGTPAELIPAA
jgi:hypothetical protein